MTEQFRCLAIEFYFDPGIKEFREERLDRARRILIESGAVAIESTQNLRSGIEAVVFSVLVPAHIANLHHGFESKFNKAWPEGCGAGFVEEIQS